MFHSWVRLITFPWFQLIDKYDYHSIYEGSVGNVLSREIWFENKLFQFNFSLRKRCIVKVKPVKKKLIIRTVNKQTTKVKGQR